MLPSSFTFKRFAPLPSAAVSESNFWVVVSFEGIISGVRAAPIKTPGIPELPEQTLVTDFRYSQSNLAVTHIPFLTPGTNWPAAKDFMQTRDYKRAQTSVGRAGKIRILLISLAITGAIVLLIVKLRSSRRLRSPSN